MPRWRSTGPPSCRTSWSTRACSCTAATATCSSTRSRGPTWTAGSRRSTAAPPRSRRKSSAAPWASEPGSETVAGEASPADPLERHLMDFDLPETALAVRDGVAAVAAKYDNAYWSRCEEEHRFPDEVYKDLA